MNVVDLFAGGGGLSEGFWKEGYNVFAHVEMNPDACETLKTRTVYHCLKKAGRLDKYYKFLKGEILRDELKKEFNLEKSFENIFQLEIDKENYLPLINQIKEACKNNPVDIIIGGPPCQAYSYIGRAKDKNRMQYDKRNYLYEFYIEFLKGLNPKLFIFENVPGLLTAGGGKYLQDMLEGMRSLKYTVPDPRIINAADFGVPQNRKRVIMIGWKKGLNINLDEIFQAIDKKNEYCVLNFLEDLPQIKAGTGEHLSNYKKDSEILRALGIRTKDDILLDHIARPHNTNDLSIYKIAVQNYKKGRKLKYNQLPANLKTHNNQTSFLDRFKVVEEGSNACHTIVAHISKDGHYYIHPDIKQNRSLSIREAARLQTFPDSYKFEGSRTSQLRQIGNAVPPMLSEVVAKRLKKYFQ